MGNRAAAHRAYARHAGPGADKVVRLAGTQSPRIETGGFQVALTLNMYSGAAGNFKHVYLSKRKSHAPLAMPLIPLSRSNTPSWNMALNRDARRQCRPAGGHDESLWPAAGKGEGAPTKLAVCDDREAEIELEADDRGNGGVFACAQLVR